MSETFTSSKRRLALATACALGGLVSANAYAQTAVFLNEIHYDNDGADTGEFVEIAGPAGTDLTGWQVVLYNGSSSIRAPYDTINLTGVIPDQQNGHGTLAFFRAGIQNGSPDGLALVDAAGALVQFLSYEGTFEALSGPAAGMTSADIGASEGSSTPVGDSLQLAGTGFVFEDFNFAGSAANTAGDVNSNQTFDEPIPPPVVTIAEIQGAGHISPFAGQVVETSGVVTFVAGNGFYLQDPDGDFDDNTSEGIFVFTSSAPAVSSLDEIDITGAVQEFQAGGPNTGNLTITELTNPTITITGRASSLPPAVQIGGELGLIPPATVIDNDGFDPFDPAQDGIDFYESLEAMLVKIAEPTAVSNTNQFGEIWVRVAGATGINAEGGLTISESDFNPERIQIDDSLFSGDSPQAAVGDRLSDVEGVVSYAFGNYEVLPSVAPTVIAGSSNSPERSELVGTRHHLSVASFNVENLDARDSQDRFDALGEIIARNLRSPDIIGLQEVQDNSGPTNDGVVSADQTYNRLISAIIAAGGASYSFTDIAPKDGEDGGEPGGNIRVGYLFRPDRVSLSGTPGDADTATVVLSGPNGAELSLNPGRVFPTDGAFDNSRKPLAASFEFGDESVFVINNHFRSRGGSDPLFGDQQPPAIGGEDRRRDQAEVVRDFVRQIRAVEPDARIVVLGDFNAFEFEPTLETIEDGGALQNLTNILSPTDRYSFNFEGNSQALDHMLVSGSLQVGSQYDIVRVNASFTDGASDHDPAVARLNLVRPIVP